MSPALRRPTRSLLLAVFAAACGDAPGGATDPDADPGSESSVARILSPGAVASPSPEIEWSPVAGARVYTLELSGPRTATFEVDPAACDADRCAHRLAFEDALEAGTYELRVDGGAAHAFEVRADLLAPPVAPGLFSERPLVAWAPDATASAAWVRTDTAEWRDLAADPTCDDAACRAELATPWPVGERVDVRLQIIEDGVSLGWTPIATTDVLSTRGRMPVIVDDDLADDEVDFLGAEGIAALEAFDWATAPALPERDSAGRPTVFYMALSLDAFWQHQAFDEIGLRCDFMPLFREELAGVGDRGLVGSQVSFCLVPGVVYETLRAEALIGDDRIVFPAMIVRTPPGAAASADGSVTYAALNAQGYRPYEPLPGEVLPNPTPTAGPQPALFGWVARKVVEKVAGAAKAVVDEVRDGIGVIQEELHGEAMLDIDIQVLNTDELFGKERPMLRAWGVEAGQELAIRNMSVIVKQGWGLSRGGTDAAGRARIEVVKNKPMTVCFDLQNHAAKIVKRIMPVRLCEWNLAPISVSTSRTLRVRHPYLNILAQASDSYDYMKRVAGVDMRRATILVGGLADMLSPKDRAYAVCGSMFNPGLHLTLTQAILGVGGPVTWAAEFLMSVDIIMDDADGPGWEPYSGYKDMAALVSRGVPTHEYGHFTMCNLMSNEDTWKFGQAWMNLFTQLLLIDQVPENEAAVFAEAWADFFASQVVGGVNYFEFPAGAAYPAASGAKQRPVRYCRYNSNDCLEHNYGSAAAQDAGEDFDDQVAILTTILHDVFDREPSPYDVPQMAAYWWNNPAVTGLSVLRPGYLSTDEVIGSPGQTIVGIYAAWEKFDFTLTTNVFLRAVTVAIGNDPFWTYSYEEVCALLALHTVSGICDPAWMADLPHEPIACRDRIEPCH